MGGTNLLEVFDRTNQFCWLIIVGIVMFSTFIATYDTNVSTSNTCLCRLSFYFLTAFLLFII